MTREEVRDLFIRKGFNLREVKSPDYTVVEHKDEVVGFIYDDSVYVAENYPSLNSPDSQSYANTKRTIVMFTSPVKTLEDAIDFLLDSPSRIDRETREQRAENVRKYFKERKDAETILNQYQSSFDYTKLTDQSTTEKL